MYYLGFFSWLGYQLWEGVLQGKKLDSQRLEGEKNLEMKIMYQGVECLATGDAFHTGDVAGCLLQY